MLCAAAALLVALTAVFVQNWRIALLTVVAMALLGGEPPRSVAPLNGWLI